MGRSLLYALVVVAAASVALASVFGVNGDAAGTVSFTSADGANPGTFEISYTDPEEEPLLFTDPMQLNHGGGVDELGGDPGSPVAYLDPPGGPHHKFTLGHWGPPGSGKVIIQYYYDPLGDGNWQLVIAKIAP